MIELTADDVRNGALDMYNPARYDAEFHSDGSVTLIPVLWWDDASYARYQSFDSQAMLE